MGRPSMDYQVRVRFTTRPEAVEALERLSESTGFAKAHLMRVALDAFLVDANVLMPVDLPPTLTAGSQLTRRN